MQKISIMKVSLVTAAVAVAGCWLGLPTLKNAKLMGMARIQADALSSLSFAKEFAIVTGVPFSGAQNNMERYRAIQPYIIFQGKEAPTMTDIVLVTGFTSLEIGHAQAPVQGGTIQLY
jgi:hypothetical protein